MQKKRLYVDSSVVIPGIDNKASNSAIVLELVAAREVEAFTSENTLMEVKDYFSTNATAHEAYLAEQTIKRNFAVVPLDRVKKHLSKWRGRIKEKDLAHLATAKALRLPHIIAYDRDFKPFKEYRMPKQFLEELSLKHFDTEY